MIALTFSKVQIAAKLPLSIAQLARFWACEYHPDNIAMALSPRRLAFAIIVREILT